MDFNSHFENCRQIEIPIVTMRFLIMICPFRIEIWKSGLLRPCDRKPCTGTLVVQKSILDCSVTCTRDEDIYGCNLSGEEESSIAISKFDQSNPAIYGNIVVWSDDRYDNDDIFGYDLATHKEFQITKDPNAQSSLATYGDIAVLADMGNGEWDIYGYDFCSKDTNP
jgi:beta propeller repeat protein